MLARVPTRANLPVSSLVYDSTAFGGVYYPQAPLQLAEARHSPGTLACGLTEFGGKEGGNLVSDL